LEATADYADKTHRRQEANNGETTERPTGRMPVLRVERAHRGNPALEKCPESARWFVVLIKNEISDEGAKYEHTGKDIEKN
jgi:hypothetical protein